MSLAEIVNRLDKLDPEMTVYALPPWRPFEEAVVAMEGSKEEKEARGRGLRYFVEVFIAQEFLEDWLKTQSVRPSAGDIAGRLIEYVENDA